MRIKRCDRCFMLINKNEEQNIKKECLYSDTNRKHIVTETYCTKCYYIEKSKIIYPESYILFEKIKKHIRVLEMCNPLELFKNKEQLQKIYNSFKTQKEN